MDVNLLRQTAEFTISSAHKYALEDASREKDLRRWYRWDWSIGVGFYGLLKAWDRLQDPRLIDGMERWIDQRLDTIEDICVNTCGVMPAVLRLAELSGSKKYEEVCKRFDEYIMKQAPRTPCGAIAHTVINGEFANEIWADTLFMCILYMAKRAVSTGDRAMREDAARQLYLHITRLYDESAGLFYHGYDDVKKEALGVLWGRGNAWSLAASVEIMDIIGTEFEGSAQVIDRLASQINALEKFQRADGMWSTVIDKPEETYEESSVTAGCAYGILQGIQSGYFSKDARPIASKALNALKTNIASDGAVLKGSTGTPIKEDYTAYNQIKYFVTPFTQGLALMALSVE